MRWILMMSLLVVSIGGQTQAQESGTLTGQVIGERGSPLANTLVDVLGTSVRTLADSTGAFVIRRVPVGEAILRVRQIGYATDVRQFRLGPGDSLHIEFRLAETPIPFPGSGVPLPAADLLHEAATLLPRLLEDSSVIAYIFRESAWTDFVVLRAPWLSDEAWTTIVGDRSLRFVTRCDHCSSGTAHTVEGGLMYHATIPHVRLGVMTQPAQTPMLTFCFDPVRAGQGIMMNCGGLGRTLLVTYARFEDGQWVRLSHH